MMKNIDVMEMPAKESMFERFSSPKPNTTRRDPMIITMINIATAANMPHRNAVSIPSLLSLRLYNISLMPHLLTSKYQIQGVTIKINTVMREPITITDSVSSAMLVSKEENTPKKDKTGEIIIMKNANNSTSRAKICVGFLILKSIKEDNT